jgi:teichuronic acid biosynthesis glycosyltransferase TuaC
MPRISEPARAAGGASPAVTVFSTVHPSPWAPTKGSFNKAMLHDLASRCDVQAIVPVPWPERLRPSAPAACAYPVTYPTFAYLPSVAPLWLARQLEWSTRRDRRRASGVTRGGAILAYWTDPDGTVAVDWAEALGCPAVLLVGGSDILMLAREPKRRRRMADTLQRASHVLTVGKQLAASVMELGVPSKRVTPILRGVDRSVFHPGDRPSARERLGLPADRPVLLWVGRMVPVKGLEVLLAALATPKLRELSPLVVLVGDGPLRTALESQAAGLGLTDLVRFVGSRSGAELPEWYRAADLTVLPSRSEGIPNVLLESLACGTGFVASDVGAIREISAEPDEELVPPGDSMALVERLVARIDSPRQVKVSIPDLSVATTTILDVVHNA